MVFYPVKKYRNQWEVYEKIENVVPGKILEDTGQVPEEVFDLVKEKVQQSTVAYLKYVYFFIMSI